MLNGGGTLRKSRGLLLGQEGVVRKLNAFGFCATGLHQDYPVGCARTIDGGRSRILEDGNALDRIGIDGIQTRYHSVNHDQRTLSRINGSQSTNANGRTISTGTTRLLLNGNTRRQSLQQVAGGGHLTLEEFLLLQRDDRTGNSRFLLLTITDYDHFRQIRVDGFHLNRNSATLHFHVLRLQSYAAKHEGFSLLYRNGEISG